MMGNSLKIIILFLMLSEWSHVDAGKIINLIPNNVAAASTRLERVTQMLQSDSVKLQGQGGKLPLFAGGAIGTGQYSASLKVGTPPQELMMVIDTESDLTWMNCRTDREEGETTPLFDANKSTSFSVLPCGSTTCQQVAHQNIFKMDKCASTKNNSHCGFSYSYEKGDLAGDLATEIVTFDGTTTTTTTTKLQVLVTCTDNYSQGLNNILFNASGVLGLGINSSLLNKASGTTNLFSYCLVDTFSPINVSSYLILGSRNGVNTPLNQPMQYTKLVPNAGRGLYYGVNIEAVYVNGARVNIDMTKRPLEGVIVDSGAMGTYLVEAAYKPIMAAIKKSFAGFKRASGPFDVCYDTTGLGVPKLGPKLEFVFGGGARFVPRVESYVLGVDEGNMTCVGLIDATAQGNSYSVIGSTLQELFLWEFDLCNNKLGFASSSCAQAA